jgi:hypothetical protein
MSTPEPTPTLSDTTPIGLPSRWRIRLGLVLTVIGLAIFLLGARPSLFGLDRSPVVGFVQISVFLVGLAVIYLGGYVCLHAFWKNGSSTIASDIGSRLAATGYVIVVFAGMADVFGLSVVGTYKIPFFGPWQAVGVQAGEAVIAIGFLLMIPFRRVKTKPREEVSSPA